MALKPRIAVDWDDTCVDGVWPERNGEWKPGAIEALRALTQVARVVIWTTRVAPVLPEWQDYAPRTEGDIRSEVLAIRERLDEEGLTDIEVWTKPWKVDNCAAYVDDKAVLYRGQKDSWANLVEKLTAMVEVEGTSKTKSKRGSSKNAGSRRKLSTPSA